MSIDVRIRILRFDQMEDGDFLHNPDTKRIQICILYIAQLTTIAPSHHDQSPHPCQEQCNHDNNSGTFPICREQEGQEHFLSLVTVAYSS